MAELRPPLTPIEQAGLGSLDVTCQSCGMAIWTELRGTKLGTCSVFGAELREDSPACGRYTARALSPVEAVRLQHQHEASCNGGASDDHRVGPQDRRRWEDRRGTVSVGDRRRGPRHG